MDLFTSELEDLASRFCGVSCCAEPEPETIKRWERLFHLADASTAISDHRAALDRATVSDEHWNLVRDEKEIEGHDRESYEYSLAHRPPKARISPTIKAKVDPKRIYLFRLEASYPEISSTNALSAYLGLAPETLLAEKDEECNVFVRISGQHKADLESQLAQQYPSLSPLFVRLTLPASKDIDPTSYCPTLGIDTTLPQFRSSGATAVTRTGNFPVRYFIYGTLCDSECLGRVLQRDPESIVYEPASVNDAKLTNWGKYRGIINGQETVQGSAYWVESEDAEWKLRDYETDRYEVVRCDIKIEGEGIATSGLTFRLIEDE